MAEHRYTSVKRAEYARSLGVKKGFERLDRRSASGTRGDTKKSGHGGKFTWDGPNSEEEDYDVASPPVTDRNDPNYVDEPVKEEEKKVAEEKEVGIAAAPAAVFGLAELAAKLPVAAAAS
ncbi:unnamed protein product [Sphagnum troendelagicum]|jgi:hypothetical protein|uniref:Hyaluronan/mRNA-binding protein domain-containing protein n=2 Tax=Sphagnum TaxID=13804 RepID=A0ABP0USU0_9BRYO